MHTTRNSGGYGTVSGLPPGFQFQARITVKTDDPILEVLLRSTKVGERPAWALRRALHRYAQVCEGTPPPPGDIVAILGTVTATSRSFLHQLSYPPKEVVASAIRSSTVPTEQRQQILSYLDRCTYAEYARLIEAVELL